ncbi:YqkE family protein [Bacillus marasmi]|uniref:YqkE family protein n=1 Tax=Bacillus marasmi TaxID=1926279 RepID=UPI001FE359D9|nr:YqkE family protein [Bacillus marasmi]
MKKKQRSKVNQNQKSKKDDAPVTLGDMLNSDLVNQLKNKQQELKAEEVRKQEAEEQRLREERKRREKNKSFEELLNESSISWKDFK